MLTRILVAIVRAYQLALSPYLGMACRFHPTCSDYAMSALRAHGPLKGGWLTVKRIGKCHPWHPGGIDPVPNGHDHRAQTRTIDG